MFSQENQSVASDRNQYCLTPVRYSHSRRRDAKAGTGLVRSFPRCGFVDVRGVYCLARSTANTEKRVCRWFGKAGESIALDFYRKEGKKLEGWHWDVDAFWELYPITLL